MDMEMSYFGDHDHTEIKAYDREGTIWISAKVCGFTSNLFLTQANIDQIVGHLSKFATKADEVAQ